MTPKKIRFEKTDANEA